MPADAQPPATPSDALSVGVIVCAYSFEREDDLTEAVESLLAQTRPLAEVVVVIDHNPQLLAAVEQHFSETNVVRVIENSHRQGLSGARNSGVAAIRTDIVGFLDDDATAAPDWAERIVAHYADRDVIGAGGAIDPQWQRGRPKWFPSEFDWVVGCTYTGMPDEVSDVRNMIGANMSLRRTVFARVGHFSETVGRVGKRPVGCEETELCIRALRTIDHARIVYDSAARVRHKVPAERASFGYFRLRCFMEGVSKAQVARLAGAADALSTERAYTFKVLPRAIVRGLGDAVRGDFNGLRRAAAVAVGPLIAAAGYLRGRVAANAFSGAVAAADREEPTR